MIRVDCDLDTLTQEVLSFLDKFIPDKSIIIFDDWFNFEYLADPENHGERKTLNEWKLKEKLTAVHTVDHWSIAVEFAGEE